MAARARKLSRALRGLPPADFAIAYGSGAFPQVGYTKSQEAPMIDFILAVDDSMAWHAKNIEWNPDHYALPSLGARAISCIQEWGHGVYYHPYVPVKDEETGETDFIKYGVMTTAAVREDLEHWTTLFASGRLHKPTALVEDRLVARDPDFYRLLRHNERHALHLALLMLPESFSEEELYVKIASLSYTGDIRFVAGAEAPSKVRNIVRSNPQGFRDMYTDLIVSCKYVDFVRGGGRDSGIDAAEQRMERSVLQRDIVSLLTNIPGSVSATPAVLATSRASPSDFSPANVAAALGNAIQGVMRRGQLIQYGKGALTAGPSKALEYLAAKMRKGRRRVDDI
jgi:translocator assembly and maintenance protein 41